MTIELLPSIHTNEAMHGAPAWGPQGQDIYERTYSRVMADGRKETWFDTVDRVVNGNLALVGEDHWQALEREKLFDLIYSFKAIPAGRHLWVSGVPDREYSRNCHRAGWGTKLSDHFGFLMSELMAGGGVGANYASEYLAALEPLSGSVTLDFMCSYQHADLAEFEHKLSQSAPDGSRIVVVDDSREGWVDAVVRLVDAFTASAPVSLVIDVSCVRPRGAPIVKFGGVASGPGPLIDALGDLFEILTAAAAEGSQLSPLGAMDMDHAIAAMVISGNVRRSARMSILPWNDPHIFSFLDCKLDPAKHWTTNISVEIDDSFFLALNMGDEHATNIFDLVTERMALNGEPGFFNSSLASVGETGDVRCTNPCGEIALEEFEACNLGSVNLATVPEWEAVEAFELMARFLLRATMTKLTDVRQEAIENKNRRIGVGIFGVQEWAADRGVRFSQIHHSERLAVELNRYRDAACAEADRYADELGIPRPIKATTIAPTGTTAKLAGVTEGAHPVFARHYERRVRFAANDPKLVELDARGLDIEDCLYSKGTKVVVYHTADPIVQRFPAEMIEQADEIALDVMLKTQAFFQRHYATNAVSFTANFDPELPLRDIRSALRASLPFVKGTTLMPNFSRPQSPYTSISAAEYLAATDHAIGQAELECAGGACPIR